MTRYRAPLSAKVLVVDGSNAAYVNALKLGYSSCLPKATSASTAVAPAANKNVIEDVTFDRSKCKPETISDFQDSGLTLSDIYCEDFFRQANATARQRQFARGATNDVGGAIQAILGLAKATTGVISGVGAGAAFADSTFRNYDESFMVDADLSRMRRLVNAAQDKMRLDFKSQDKPEAKNSKLTVFAAESRIQRYAGLCTFLGMKNLLDASLADKTERIENDNKQAAAPNQPTGDKKAGTIGTSPKGSIEPNDDKTMTKVESPPAPAR